MRFALLTTDALFFALLFIALVYVVYAWRREHLRAPWREVARKPLAVIAGVVLSCFLLIAVLDSIHFYPRIVQFDGGGTRSQYDTELISVFDHLVTPLRAQVEKSYSAPLAIYAYSKETIDTGTGKTRRDYPRLRWAGAHLSDPEEHKRDLWQRFGGGIVWGLAGWVMVVAVGLLVTCGAQAKRLPALLLAVYHGDTNYPMRSFFAVTATIAVIVAVCVKLGPYYHLFGTDKVGIDVFYQTLKSIRTGLIIGTLTTLVMLPFAIVLGITAGYFRGWIDDLIQYLYTTLSSIPGVLLIAAAALILEVYMVKHADEFASLVARADLRLLALCVILGITSWTSLCRLLRGEALKLRDIEFVEAARAFGAPHRSILLQHMVPNIMHIVMISIVLDFSGLVLAEAVLSYINIGVDPTMESWGNMINSARLELAREPIVWWSLLAAFVFMFTLVLAANLFADAVRDAFDPRLRVMS